MVYICKAILQKMDLESGLEEILACVADAVFRSDAADVYISCVEQFQNLSERLAGIVYTFITGVLLNGLVASFVESELLACVWKQVFMNLSSTGAGYAVGRPYAAEFHE